MDPLNKISNGFTLEINEKGSSIDQATQTAKITDEVVSSNCFKSDDFKSGNGDVSFVDNKHNMSDNHTVKILGAEENEDMFSFDLDNFEDLGELEEELLKSIEENEDVIVESDDVIEESEDVIVKSDDVIEESDDVIEESENVIVESDGVIEESEDVIIKSEDVIIKSEDIIVESDDVIEESEEVVNESDVKILGGLEKAEKNEEVIEESNNLVDESQGKAVEGFVEKREGKVEAEEGSHEIAKGEAKIQKNIETKVEAKKSVEVAEVKKEYAITIELCSAEKITASLKGFRDSNRKELYFENGQLKSKFVDENSIKENIFDLGPHGEPVVSANSILKPGVKYIIDGVEHSPVRLRTEAEEKKFENEWSAFQSALQMKASELKKEEKTEDKKEKTSVITDNSKLSEKPFNQNSVGADILKEVNKKDLDRMSSARSIEKDQIVKDIKQKKVINEEIAKEEEKKMISKKNIARQNIKMDIEVQLKNTGLAVLESIKTIPTEHSILNGFHKLKKMAISTKSKIS